MQKLFWDDIWSPINDSPLLVVLNYSGGKQSHCIARKLLRGEIEFPECPFLAVAADPGNEHHDTITCRDNTFSEFRKQGHAAIVAEGPDMLVDLEERKASESRHIDQPALWTVKGGQLPQHCTRHYKIRPMNRVVSWFMKSELGITRWPSNSVERWVGFAYDETHRASKLKFDDHRQQARFPLIDLKMTRDDVLDWYSETGEYEPPRSVCNHCWANGIHTFQRIYETDPDGWQKAKDYDKQARDLSQFGVAQEAYCSRSLLSLEDLEKANFELSGRDADVLSCDSGYCFV